MGRIIFLMFDKSLKKYISISQDNQLGLQLYINPKLYFTLPKKISSGRSKTWSRKSSRASQLLHMEADSHAKLGTFLRDAACVEKKSAMYLCCDIL